MRRFLCILALLSVAAFADDAAQESRFLTQTRQLIYEGKRSGEGYFHPDGNLLIFQSEREPGNPFYQIDMLNFETGDTTRVSPGKGKTTCSFSQPGTDRVIFASTHADPDALKKQKTELDFRASGKQRRYSWDYDEHFEIYSANRDGSDLKNLTNSPGYDDEGSFSPAVNQLSLTSLRASFPVEDLRTNLHNCY